MELHKGLLFHGRYLLLESLGCGASAEVWRARDTKANNLVVALKIFSQNAGMDSYGYQNFVNQFTAVYNMKHSNLLPATGYDKFEGKPYLVMQYCENGSCSSMIGRVEEDDVIKFLHDVAAGLEYLHDHNIIHLDIKPDNIMLDDNCNFMVTDFGISVVSGHGVTDSNGMSGGTRAYMGPERFGGKTSKESDIWALGATAYELLTGTPPFGDHGGLLQAEGEGLPELPKLQSEVANIIKSCLAADPAKRIKAFEIRQKIELYWETGSWTRPSQKNTIAIAVTAAASVLLCLGIFLWDYNRTKVYYYKDYAERLGIPEGIGRLSTNEMRHRNQSYRMEYRRHKLTRMALVNSAGKVIGHSDTEHIVSRYSDVYYFYTDDDKIDYKKIFDKNGKLLFKMDYDENLQTATFRQNDKYGTEMHLNANVNMLFKDGASAFEDKSHISRYQLEYDNDGMLTELRYVGFGNTPACDKDNIHGMNFKYDSKGRIAEIQYVSLDGNITANSNGLAIRRYEYDDNDDWTSVAYLNVEGKGSHDGNNCSLVKLEYDEYGNRIKESYFDAAGNPSMRTDMSVYGFEYTYSDQGFRTTQTCLGIDGEKVFSKAGFVTIKDSCNDNGFVVRRDYLDENGSHTMYSYDGECYSIVRWAKSESDLELKLAIYDETDTPMEMASGVSAMVMEYDSVGNNTKVSFYDGKGAPVACDGYYYGKVMEYDEFNRIVAERYIGEDGNLATQDGNIAEIRIAYNLQGAVEKTSFHDKQGKLTNGGDWYASYDVTYDKLGNIAEIKYYDALSRPCMTSWGYYRVAYGYDAKTNLLTEERAYTAKGGLVYSTRLKYDSRGNIIQQSKVNAGGRLFDNTYVENYTYDAGNRKTVEWASDLSGRKINVSGAAYSVAKYKYDERGNCVETTYWNAAGNAAVDNLKSHRRLHEFDMMNRVVCERNFGTDGKPLSGAGVNPEGRVKYDKWGNRVEIACYDGYGKPRLSSEGYHVMKCKYDKYRNIVVQEFFGTDGQPVVSKNDGCSKTEADYDNHGNITRQTFYDKDRCIRKDVYKYNSRNNLTEQAIYDGNGKLTDKFFGVSRVRIEYDASGYVPVAKRYYFQNGTVALTQKWDKNRGDWK